MGNKLISVQRRGALPQPLTLASSGRACQLIKPRLSPLLVVHRVPSSLLGPVDPSFRALSGILKFTVRRHNFDEGSLFLGSGVPMRRPNGMNRYGAILSDLGFQDGTGVPRS